MIEETFLTYKRFRWLWVNVVFLLLLVLVYFFDRPLGGRNGGTVVGYSYGAIATAGILYLMWFGIRKRSHYARYTTLKGCLSAHVWLGVALALLVPLHSGFQFGLNVHTLAYALMMATIVSGIVGATIYLRFPQKIQSHRGGGTIKTLLEQLAVVSNDIDFVSKDRSDPFLHLVEAVDINFKPSLVRSLVAKNIDRQQKDIAGFLAKVPEKEREDAFKVVGLAKKKQQIICQIDQEIKLKFWLRTWLYFHLPLSFALLAALSIHIFSVFYYR